MNEGWESGVAEHEYSRTLLKRRSDEEWELVAAYLSLLPSDARQSNPDLVERLLAYAPELNPVEHFRARLKRHALASYCPDTLNELHHGTHAKLKSAQRHSVIIVACWPRAELD